MTIPHGFRWFPGLLGMAILLCGELVAVAESPALRLPEGFTATLFADDDLAHDISSMTIDSLGRPVVSGPGYVRILIDEDKDGRADRFLPFADGPQTGAQGMYFRDRDLICVGDAGLIRYRDADKDDRADGPPDLFLRIKTGGEHNGHAVRRGPDGWWYVIAGNMAEVTARYANLPRSPVRFPRAGTLMRLKPNLAGGQIIADGFRNAYDFDFGIAGDIFAYDSDGERDISLPWYRPTRVFHVLRGADHGWISRSWKRPDYFLDMPPVVGAFGRGSPTGVVCYRHSQFPKHYYGALFVLDWTYGRVMALPLERNGATWKSEPIEFIRGRGQFGFAPTDVEVGVDGSLYVSVGGRGTRGGVYRITYTKPGGGSSKGFVALPPREELDRCLKATQPLSSWSRAKWIPSARKLGERAFQEAATDSARSSTERIRAIEILTELFRGLPVETATQLAGDETAEVRARAVWSIGRKRPRQLSVAVVGLFLADEDPLVRRFAVEAVSDGAAGQEASKLIPQIARLLADEDRYVRQSLVPLIRELGDAEFRALNTAARKLGPQAMLTHATGYIHRLALKDSPVSQYVVELSRRILVGEHPASLRIEAARLLQLALGGLSHPQGVAPAFDGYSSPRDLAPYDRLLDEVRITLAEVYPTGDRLLDIELGRLISIVSVYNPDVLTKVLTQITDDSHPTDDVHHLLVAARIPVARSGRERVQIARALVAIDRKLADRKMPTDSNWNDRFREMYAELVKHDAELPVGIVDVSGFGRPAHVIFLGQLPGPELPKAVAAFAKAVETQADYRWTNDVVFVFTAAKTGKFRKLIRAQYDNLAVRGAVLMALAEQPEEEDRNLFIAGLASSQLEVLGACLSALEKLPGGKSARDVVALVRAVRRLGADKSQIVLRERVVKLLRKGTGKEFGYRLGKDGYRPQPSSVARWTAWVTGEYPSEAAELLGSSGADLADLKKRLAEVAWDSGDHDRGQKLFESQSCSRCHGGRTALGPSLAGAAARFSREDLFAAIALPGRDVSPRYQTTLIETKGGDVVSGLIIYESVDGLLLRNSSNQTFRIETDQIDNRKRLTTSLMPSGLLKDLKPTDLADLYQYLSRLGTQTAKAGGQNAR